MTRIVMPVRFVAGALVTAEDDSPDAIQASITTALRCSPGDRIANPGFGTVLPLFDEATVDVVGIALDQVQEFVPDAERTDIEAALQMVPA